MDNTAGVIFDIKRYSIHDGPCIRTTVFFKGCPLSCSWCHNPESVSMDRELMYWRDRCIGCGNCLSVCQNSATSTIDGRVDIDHNRCIACGI